MTQATGMRIPGFIDYKHSFSYEDGTLRFVEPKLTTTRAGREFHARGQGGTIGPDQTHVTVTGDVVLTASDGLKAETDEATYSSGEAMVRVPRKIEFAKGRLRGSGVGMTYDQPREVMWLLDQARITVAPDKGKDPGLTIVAGAAGMARREKYFRFERGFNATREGRDPLVGLGDGVPDRRRGTPASRSSCAGNSRIVMSGAIEGGLQSMDRARHQPRVRRRRRDARTRRAGRQRRDAAGGRGGAAGAAHRRQGDRRHRGPDGAVTSLVARDKVRAVVAGGQGRARAGDSGRQHGRHRRARQGAHRRAVQPRRGVPRAARRRRRRASRDRRRSRWCSAPTAASTTRSSAAARRFEDGVTRARALEAQYLVAKGQLQLSGDVKTQPPTVSDDRITVEATGIDLTLRRPEDGRPRQRPEREPAGQEERAQPRAEAHVPGMLKDDQPTNVTAAALDYDGALDKAVYTGGARLWQKDTAIAAETITIDEKTGDLYARNRTRSARRCRSSSVDSKTSEKKTVTSIASAKDMHYEDALRRATYTTDAHVNGPQGDLRAVKIEMYLVEGGGSLEQGRGLRPGDAQGRRAHGQGTAHDVLRRRRAVPDDRIAGEHRRRMPRNYRQNFDFLQIG